VIRDHAESIEEFMAHPKIAQPAHAALISAHDTLRAKQTSSAETAMPRTAAA
jgi:hypothetical protein